MAAVVTVVLWASAFVGIRDLADVYSPGSIALGRLLIGVGLLGVLTWRRGWAPVSRRDLTLIIASGIIWFALYNVALNEAERHVDAGTAALLVNTGPIFIGFFAAAFLGEGLPRRLLAGMAVAFGGSLVIAFATSDATNVGDQSLIGVGLSLLAALAYASGVTLQKPASANVPALQLTWLACAVGTIVCLPFAPTLLRETMVLVSTSSEGKLGWLVYLGVFPTSIAFTTWAYALTRTPAGRLGATTYLVSPLVVAMAWLFLGELPPPFTFLGGALCILGVAIARSGSLRLSRLAARRPASHEQRAVEI